MNASASIARPSTLTVMWRIDQAPRPDGGGPSGASPMSNASPRRPVASGPVKTPTADAPNRPSLAACSATRNRASIERVGATPRKDVTRAMPITWAAMPSRGTPSLRARGADRSPANGASASAAAKAYRASAIKCGTRTTGRNAPAPRDAVAGGRSGRHLPDEPHRHARNEFGVADIQDQPRGRVIARMHDLEHHLHLLGRRARDPRCRSVHFKYVPGGHTFRPSPIDEDDLLRLDRNLVERDRRRAIRKTRNGGDGGVAEHATVGEPLLLGQEARRIELPPAQRPVGLIRVGAQHVPHLLRGRAAPVEDRLI